MKSSSLIILLFLCSIVFGQTPRVTLTKLHKIGGEANDKKEYLFAGVDFINCDSKNNLYVCDARGLRIMKYDKNGRYILQIGRAGEGPGEFKNIKAFTIDEKDNLIIIDEILSRKTVLNSDGKYVSSENIKIPYSSIAKISPFGKESFIGIGTSYPNYEEHKNKIVVVDSKFSKYETTFGHTSLFWQMDNPFDCIQSLFDRLYVLSYNNTKAYVCTQIYNGKLYIFDKNNGWNVKICQGFKFDRVQYIWYPGQQYSNIPQSIRLKAASTSIKYKGVKQSYYLYSYNQVFGITDFKDKYILILLCTVNNDNKRLGFDIYDIEGKYLGYTEISENSMYSYPTKFTLGLAIDKECNIYMKELSKDGILYVGKYKLNITQ